jgi:20S proteasome alpha/beta subunit
MFWLRLFPHSEGKTKNIFMVLHNPNPGAAFGKPIPRRKAPVTIIIGIKCKDAIVMASDSQTTEGTSKMSDAIKIARIQMGNREILVGQSGSVTLGSRAIEIIQSLAAGQSITDAKHPAQLAWKAMSQLVREMRDYRGCTMEELEQYLWKSGQECGLMVAYYFGGKPHLYTVQSLTLAMPLEINRRFGAIGCGASLGNYLLAERVTEELDINLGMVAALSAIHTVKQYDAFCGGPTKMQWLFSPDVAEPPPVLTNIDDIERYEKLIAEREHASRTSVSEELQKYLDAYLQFSER